MADNETAPTVVAATDRGQTSTSRVEDAYPKPRASSTPNGDVRPEWLSPIPPRLLGPDGKIPPEIWARVDVTSGINYSGLVIQFPRLQADDFEREAEAEWAKPPPLPYGIIDASEDDPIEPRGWVLGNTFCRKFLSYVVGVGSVGKTALRVAQAISVAINRSLTGEHVFGRGRVLYITLEDSIDELRRRVRACRLHHNVEPADLKGWLFLWAPPRDSKIADSSSGEIAPGELAEDLRSFIETWKIDLVIIDPFVKSYGGDIDENSNSAIDAVCDIIARLSIELNLAADVTHHDAKGFREPGNIDRGRGASSFRDAGRLGYSATTMSDKEAEEFGIPEKDRRSYFRYDTAKMNLGPPAAEAWFRLVGVPIGNATDAYPKGDTVQTIELWVPPRETLFDLPHEILNRILDDIDAGMPNGQRYSDSNSAKTRAAWPVVQQHRSDKTQRECKKIIATWVKTGLLFSQSYDDPINRRPRIGLRVDPGKRLGTKQ